MSCPVRRGNHDQPAAAVPFRCWAESETEPLTVQPHMTWDRWFNVVAGAVALAATFFGTAIAAGVFALVVLGVVIVRLHVGYGRPFAPQPYKAPVLTREEWGRRMMRDIEAMHPAIFPQRHMPRNRSRRAPWRRHPALALPRRNESHKPRYGARTDERRRTARVGGCLPHI